MRSRGDGILTSSFPSKPYLPIRLVSAGTDDRLACLVVNTTAAGVVLIDCSAEKTPR